MYNGPMYCNAFTTITMIGVAARMHSPAPLVVPDSSDLAAAPASIPAMRSSVVLRLTTLEPVSSFSMRATLEDFSKSPIM